MNYSSHQLGGYDVFSSDFSCSAVYSDSLTSQSVGMTMFYSLLYILDTLQADFFSTVRRDIIKLSCSVRVASTHQLRNESYLDVV
jgi:hypothetical protein